MTADITPYEQSKAVMAWLEREPPTWGGGISRLMLVDGVWLTQRIERDAGGTDDACVAKVEIAIGLNEDVNARIATVQCYWAGEIVNAIGCFELKAVAVGGVEGPIEVKRAGVTDGYGVGASGNNDGTVILILCERTATFEIYGRRSAIDVDPACHPGRFRRPCGTGP